MVDGRVAGSFRDPAGFVFTREGVLYRQVNPRFAEHYDHLMGSGLYRALTDAGLLVRHEEVDVAAHADDAHRVLRPAMVEFISFPYEWCPGQLRDAALATLQAQQLALNHGMSLRDASAFNVQFVASRPVLIDTLSFEILPQGQPWVAYRQFCQHFLAPLALASSVDARLLRLLGVHLDGVPLDLAAALLPGRSRLQPGLAVHLHAHARSQRRHADDAGRAGAGKGDNKVGTKDAPHFSEQAFRGLIDSLTTAVRKQAWEPGESAWRDYYAAKESYSDEAMASKEELVAKFVGELQPRSVWDLGANTGRFSWLAARAGASVVALEMDPSAVEVSWRQVVAGEAPAILPLVMDLANPSPGLGWGSAERPSLSQRGPADLALALALIHHLAIANNVPLTHVAAWLATLCQWLVLEWVPKVDPMVRRLLASRQDVFDDYCEQGLQDALSGWFDVVQREPVHGSQRTLYLLRRR
ncbi:MAG: SAM-dependent methyltransferase [Actinomycetota bacterium]|nr:SAM-dependent methyltransferase [Actinomycetota bacterium]